MADKKNVMPFGLLFLETPSEEELKAINGGRHHHKKHPTSGGGAAPTPGPGTFTSMDIIAPSNGNPGSFGT